MATIKKFNETTQQWERMNAGGVTDGVDKYLPQDVIDVDEARKELIREKVHSGVLDYYGSIATSVIGAGYSKGRGVVVTPQQTDYLAHSNAFSLGITDVNVNGNTVTVDTTNGYTKIQLSPPPTFGERDDLVFLETWHPQDDPYNMSWRIRVVDGVDFEKYKVDGFLESSVGVSPTMNNSLITPQGGNLNPVSSAGDWQRDKFLTVTQRSYYNSGTAGASNDSGLYIAGKGDSTSKDLLLTADGYVYAIPLFRVKRRNSGGYRVDNLNGAREYENLNNLRFSFDTDVMYGTETTFTAIVDAQNVSKLKVGDIIGFSKPSIKITEIIDSDTVRAIWLEDRYVASGANATYNVIFSDRPDNKYANIIDKDDIIDLRHKVSLKKLNLNEILDDNFDKLLRGKLQTKEKPELVKERYNLMPAPKEVEQKLVGTMVKGDDGVERELVNELGVIGGFETDSNGDGLADGFGYYNATSFSLVDGIGSKKAQRFNGGFIDFNSHISKMVHGKYYIIAIDYKKDTATSAELRYYNGSTGAMYSMTSTESKTLYIKFLRDGNGSYYSSRIVANSGYGIFDNLRIYEIDQTTYDKIDVDPEFTGEKLTQKLPYVSSYQSTIENLLDVRKMRPYMLSYPDSVLHLEEYDEQYSVNGNKISISLSGSSRGIGQLNIPINQKKYYISANFSSEWQYYRLIAYKSNGSRYLGSINGWTGPHLQSYYKTSTPNEIVELDFSTTDVVKIDLAIYRGSSGITFPASLFVENWYMLDFPSKFIPHGKYYLPNDYAEQKTPTDFTKINSHRTILSDRMTSETRSDVVEALKTPQRHITVTQATEGQWAVGDTVKVKSDDGVVMGVVDSDTALATVMETSPSAVTTFRVSDVSKFSTNDKIVHYNPSNEVTSSERTVTSVDTVNSTITISFEMWVTQGAFIIEQSASTSSPQVTATGIAGTWSDLGTKEATYTISTVPTDNKTNVLFRYSVVRNARQGLKNLPDEVLEASVNEQKLVKDSNGVVKLKANFEGKVSGNTDLVPHTFRDINKSELATPSEGYEVSTVVYNTNISSLNGVSRLLTSSENTKMAQEIISFNLIRMVEDKFGEQVFSDCLTLADKVAKAKTLITKITADWWGYGGNVNSNALGKTDFVGKVSGSVVENANIAKAVGNGSGLYLPSEFSYELSDGNLSDISTLNGSSYSAPATLNGNQPQHLFSFNLIEYIKREYNFTPDVAWLKANVQYLTLNWHGYGSSPSGSSAKVRIWNQAEWVGSSQNTSSTATKVTNYQTVSSPYIDGNGFIHYLAYAEPSDGVTESRIYTDFVELEVELVSGENKAEVGVWYANNSYQYKRSHANSSVTKVSCGGDASAQHLISNDGFSHFLAYAPPSNGIAPSTINTDYIELTVEMNMSESGYDVLVPENQWSELSENLLPMSLSQPVESPAYYNSSGINSYNSELLPMQERGKIRTLTQSLTTATGFIVTLRNSEIGIAEGDILTIRAKLKANTSDYFPMFLSSGDRVMHDVSGGGGYIDGEFVGNGSTNTYLYFRVGSSEMPETEVEISDVTVVRGGVEELPKVGRVTYSKKKTTHNFLGKVADSEAEVPHKGASRIGEDFINPTQSPSLFTDSEITDAEYDLISKGNGLLLTIKS